MTCARPRAQLASILLLTAVIACGCASSASTPSQPTANRSTLPIELVLYARDAQRRESYYEVRRDGTLAWGGGRDALDGSLQLYEAGTWGPAAADRLLERDGRRWRRL